MTRILENIFHSEDIVLDKITNNRNQLVKISIRVRYDGYGNSVVRFLVGTDGEDIVFEKHDSAVRFFMC